MSKETGHEEPSGGQIVTTRVRFRERWSWALHRVDASAFLRSVGAAVIAGALAMVPGPQDPVAVATIAAIGGASIMFGGNLIWNLYHHAWPEILSDRLTAAGEKIAQLDNRKDRQDALDELAKKLEEGEAIKNDRGNRVAVWSQQYIDWRDATKKLLESRFTLAEASLFRASRPRKVLGGRQDVARDLASLNGQLEVIEKIIWGG